MELFYFNVICEEVDMFDGKIIHINEKAKTVEDVCQIINTYFKKYPMAHWEIYPCSVKI